MDDVDQSVEKPAASVPDASMSEPAVTNSLDVKATTSPPPFSIAMTWRHHLPASAPVGAFLAFLSVGRSFLRPDMPPIGLLAPALIILVVTFILAEWTTFNFRLDNYNKVQGTVWSRQALRNSLLSNILYTFLTQGRFSTAEFLSGMLFNYLGSVAEEYLGKESSVNAWDQLKQALKTFAILTLLRFFIPSALSLDSILKFLVGAYQRACFNALTDLTIAFVATPCFSNKRRLQALGLVVLYALVCIFILLPTPFFQKAATTSACPARWTNIMLTYLCNSNITLEDPFALHRQMACSFETNTRMTMREAQEHLSASADYVAQVCGSGMLDYLQLRSCQTSMLMDTYGPTCPRNLMTYIETAVECSKAIKTGKYHDFFEDALGILKAFRGRRTKVTGFEMDAMTQAMLIGALPGGMLESSRYAGRLKELWTAQYL